jgi:chromosome segregation ATPase
MSLEDMSLEQRDELAMLAKQLADNPSTRKEFLRMTKQVKPELSIPELDIEDYTNRKVTAAEERVMGLEAKLRERDAREELEKRRAKLNRSTQEVEQIEKLMLDKGMTNHETAAEYFDWMRQAAEPTPNSAMGYTPSALNKFDLSKYWKNPQMGAREEAAQALKDLRKNTRPIGI